MTQMSTVQNDNIKSEYSYSALAYVGDAVFELLARNWAIKNPKVSSGVLHKNVVNIVNAVSQSNMVNKITETLTDDEQEVYRKGRNLAHNSIPKNASPGQYSRATGLEALFGFLYLSGQNERMQDIFDLCMTDWGI